MNVLVFGSINIDHVYEVDHFVRPGETLAVRNYKRFCGGKGANQAVALARTGIKTSFVGKVGKDGEWTVQYLSELGVDVSGIQVVDGPSGVAIIQITPEGENSILLLGGANHAIKPEDVAPAIKPFKAGDMILLQNEITALPDVLRAAKAKGLKIFFNPAPMDDAVSGYPLELVDCLIVNETEGAALSGKSAPEEMITELRNRFPHASVLLTLGGDGVIYADSQQTLKIPALKVKAVDTTAAGDTFIGYYMAGLAQGLEIKASLERASKAAALKVTRLGAAQSIPTPQEVEAFHPAP